MNNNKFAEENNHLLQFTVDGNENLLNFDSQTTSITTKSDVHHNVDDLNNDNNQLIENQEDPGQQPPFEQHKAAPFDNEFGPETDVDAGDEAMLTSSPHSISQEDDMIGKEYQQFEQKEIDFSEEKPQACFEMTNPFEAGHGDQMVTETNDEFGQPIEHGSFFEQEKICMIPQDPIIGNQSGDDLIDMPKEDVRMMDIVQSDDGLNGGGDVVCDTETIDMKSREEHQYEEFLKQTAGKNTFEDNVFGLPKEVLAEDEEHDERKYYYLCSILKSCLQLIRL